jgi:hypothetical protein
MTYAPPALRAEVPRRLGPRRAPVLLRCTPKGRKHLREELNMKRFAWMLVMAGASMAFACAAPDESASNEGEQELAIGEGEHALSFDRCALVRCGAGLQCQLQHGRPVCLPSKPLSECTSDADCRLFSNYCDGCACLALSVGEQDPVCKGSLVACFVDPCVHAEAQCVAGQCVLGGEGTRF